MAFKQTLNTYYLLTKPGILYGNAIAVIAGFFLASRHNIHLNLLAEILIGVSMVIASACVFNNYLDRGIDAKMERTKERAMVKKLISSKNALIYASLLGLLGFFVLFFYINTLTGIIGLIGFFVYIILYGISKRKTIHGTVIGSISGAVPPVAGYTAVTNNFDLAALLLFLILTFWQMPHFYSIALYRSEEYKKANIPVLPLIKGIKHTKIEIILYITAFVISTSLLTIFHYTGYIYLTIILIFGVFWLWKGIKGLRTNDTKKWARKMFGLSLVTLLTFSLLLCLSAILP